MKIRTDFVTNSSSSCFSVVLKLKHKDGNIYSFENNPYDYSEDGGEAYFDGGLEKILKKNHKADIDEVLSRDHEMLVNTKKNVNQLIENLHVGAKVRIKEYSYTKLEIFWQNVLLGHIFLRNHETIHKLITNNKYDVYGVVTRVLPSKRKDSLPSINIRIIADTDETTTNVEKTLLAFDTVKELCDFLTESVKDDCDDWRDEDDTEWVDHKREMEKIKKKFTKEVTDKIKKISDIQSISVEREYSAWGEFADLIADNDYELCEFAEKVMESNGEERKKIMEDMKRYIQTPNWMRGGDNFARDCKVDYIWDGDDEALLKLCKRLTSNIGPDSVNGNEWGMVNVQTGEYTTSASFVLE